jgi:hypothetical protein
MLAGQTEVRTWAQECARALAGRVAGHSLLPPTAWERVGAALRLSTREVQIVRGVFDDHKEEQIACELGISPQHCQYVLPAYLQEITCLEPAATDSASNDRVSEAGRFRPRNEPNVTGESDR